MFSTITQFIPTLCNILIVYCKLKDFADLITKFTDEFFFEVTGSYATYYLLGYLLYTCNIKLHYRYFFYIATIVGSIMTVALRECSNNVIFIEFYSFNVVMETLGGFIFFKYVVKNWIEYLLKFNFIKKLIESLSETSLGIYLIHVAILRVYSIIDLHSYFINPIIGVPIFSFIVMLTCYIIIYILRKITIFRVIT